MIFDWAGAWSKSVIAATMTTDCRESSLSHVWAENVTVKDEFVELASELGDPKAVERIDTMDTTMIFPWPIAQLIAKTNWRHLAIMPRSCWPKDCVAARFVRTWRRGSSADCEEGDDQDV